MERKEHHIQIGDQILVEDFKNRYSVPAVVDEVRDSNKGHTVSLVTAEGTPYSFSTGRMSEEGVYISKRGTFRFYTKDGLRKIRERIVGRTQSQTDQSSPTH